MRRTRLPARTRRRELADSCPHTSKPSVRPPGERSLQAVDTQACVCVVKHAAIRASTMSEQTSSRAGAESHMRLKRTSAQACTEATAHTHACPSPHMRELQRVCSKHVHT
eukprot:5254774-Pleurochrysis_carterae.AAC.2